MNIIQIVRESGIVELLNLDLVRRVELVPANVGAAAEVRVYFDDNHRVNFSATEAQPLVSKLNAAGT